MVIIYQDRSSALALVPSPAGPGAAQSRGRSLVRDLVGIRAVNELGIGGIVCF